LGTYSARLIARAHGGDIEMKSGSGTVEVSVFLPA
jgi:signal transduction histidine kinase